ncbi:hypothetical protein pETSU_036 [Edwardsiella phage pEt-SU]|uniref:Uncharacterized protein n=1 Tax=Edwardsiella phage pEt-SU TaxID=2562142 RepID=A0A4D6DW60_9CAUD|nr:hypothetical protein HOV39_gp036 [Edwardsiella phage pEt-SU]QBZ70617.1 hypothetical protein pETSU_036 [Edwardsiella phage pEt-SU]
MDFQDDLTHYSRIIAGLESVHEHINYNAGIDVDGTYALTVLELQAQDEGYIEGTEGFMDSVKKGAQDIVKWIKQVLTAIGNFLIGKKKAQPIWQDKWSEINVEEVKKSMHSLYGNALNAIATHLTDDKFDSVRPYFKFMDLDKLSEKATVMLKKIDDPDSYGHSSLFHDVRQLSKDILAELERVEKAIKGLDLKATGSGIAANKLTTLAGALGRAEDVLMTAWYKHTEALAEADLNTSRRNYKEQQEFYDNQGKK